MKVILGKKLNMTQKFSEAGVIPVTVVSAGPCVVTQVKGAKDGYHALQIGFGTTRRNTKPVAGHVKGLAPVRHIKEFRMEAAAERGQLITVSLFKPGDIVQVMGVAKGKGFQGVVKRHHFHGAPKTHGHKDQLRMPGSIGAGGVQNVLKGTRMAGRMGGQQVTVKNLEIIEIDAEKNLLYIKGALPGARNGLLAISGEGEMVFAEPKAEENVEVVVEAPVAEAVDTAPDTVVSENASEEPKEADQVIEEKSE